MTIRPNKIRSVEELIAAYGGPSAFAREIGVTPQHATMMKRRRSIPISYWRRLIKPGATKARGVTADFLLTIHEREAAK